MCKFFLCFSLDDRRRLDWHVEATATFTGLIGAFKLGGVPFHACSLSSTLSILAPLMAKVIRCKACNAKTLRSIKCEFAHCHLLTKNPSLHFQSITVCNQSINFVSSKPWARKARGTLHRLFLARRDGGPTLKMASS